MASFCPAVISASGRREAASTSLPSKGAVTVRSALDARSFWYSSSVSESCFWASTVALTGGLRDTDSRAEAAPEPFTVL